MGKKAPKAPKPVDPRVIANAQAGANRDTAAYQQQLNMVNSSGPLVNSSWTADANAPGGYRQNTSFNPQMQGMVNDLTSGIRSSGGYQYEVNPQNQVSDAMYAQARSRLDPQFEQSDSQIRTQLANQGLTPGGEAYDRAYMNFLRGKNDAYNQANWSSIQAGEQAGLERANLRNNAVGAGYNNLQGLYGLAAAATPQYNPVGVAGTDVTGAYGLNAQMQQNAYNAQMANYQSGMNGLFSLGSAALTAWNPLAGIAAGAAGGVRR